MCYRYAREKNEKQLAIANKKKVKRETCVNEKNRKKRMRLECDKNAD